MSEVSQTEKDHYHMVSLTYEVLENGTNEPIYKIEIDTCRTQSYSQWGRDKLRDWG